MNKLFLIFIVCLVSVSSFVAQERLTLDNCLDILFKQSRAYKMLELQSKKNKLNYKLSSAFKYPIMNFNLGIPFSLSQNVEDVFNSNLNQYRLILNNTNRFGPNASLFSSYGLPTGGNVSMQLATNYNTFNSKYSNDRKSFSYSLWASLSQPIFRTNRHKITEKKVEQEFRKAKLSFFTQKNKLIFDVIEKFYNTLLEQKRISLTKLRIKKEEDELKWQRLNLKLGKTSEIEFVNKKLAVKNSELDLTKIEDEFSRKMSKLLVFLGLNNNSSILLEETVKFISLSISLEDALDLVIKNNPDYKILNLNLAISQLDYKSTTTTRIETDLTASTRISNQLYYLPVDRKMKNYDYSFGVTVKIPILDGGKWDAETELSKIQLAEIKNNIAEKRIELKQLVSDYYNILGFYKKQYSLQNEKLKMLNDSQEIYKREYKMGRLTFFEFQEHKNEIYDVEKNLVATVINYNKTVLQLKIILGMEIFE